MAEFDDIKTCSTQATTEPAPALTENIQEIMDVPEAINLKIGEQ
jgi:hypothetical protein